MKPIQINNLIEPHKSFINSTILSLSSDPRILGISIAGSIANGSSDQYSDIDFVIAVEPNFIENVLNERIQIISNCGSLLNSFTGEHVGVPNLLICLYNNPLLHVDYKFVSLNDISKEGSLSHMIWQKDQRFSEALKQIKVLPSLVDPQWIEDRFWIWIHYVATKVARGENFEVLEFLSFIRSQVLVPLAFLAENKTGFGVRKIEHILPEFSKKLETTVAICEKKSLISAVEACINLYLSLRLKLNANNLIQHTNCENKAKEFVDSIR